MIIRPQAQSRRRGNAYNHDDDDDDDDDQNDQQEEQKEQQQYAAQGRRISGNMSSPRSQQARGQQNQQQYSAQVAGLQYQSTQSSELDSSTDASTRRSVSAQSTQPAVGAPTFALYPEMPQKRLQEKFTLRFQNEDENHRKVLSVRYSSGDDFIAMGMQSGEIKVFSNEQQKVVLDLRDTATQPASCTAVRWVNDASNAVNAQGLLLASYANGTTVLWHTPQRRALHRYEEDENPLNAMDVNASGTHFATGGQDCEVRLYDVGKRSAPTVLDGFEGVAPKHQNRVYAIKFWRDNENVIFSAGWDKLILLWDVRAQHTTGYMYGAQVFGDALDVCGNTLVTGSWRETKQVQLWDLRKPQAPMATLDWKDYAVPGQTKPEDSFVYCCQFEKFKSAGQSATLGKVLAGTSSSNQMRLFDADAKSRPCIDIYRHDITGSVYALDFANTSAEVAFGTADGKFAILSVI